MRIVALLMIRVVGKSLHPLVHVLGFGGMAQELSSYEAKGFGPPSPSIAKPGKIFLSPDAVHFLANDQTASSMSLAGLKLEIGGWDNQQVVFSHPNVPDWAYFVSDQKVLDDPVLGSVSQLAQQSAKAKKGRGGNRRWILAATVIILLCLSPIIYLIANRSEIARRLASKIPVKWEQDLGESTFTQIRLQGMITNDPVSLAKLEKITVPLLEAVGETKYAFQFHISRDTNINAFAIPGGHVVVNLGLINAAKRPEEVAGVLAHELAHVTQQHSIRNIIEGAGMTLLIQSLLGDAGGLLGVLGEGSSFLLQQKYSRGFEREADDVGWDYMVKAGIDPQGMIDFFKTLQALEKGSSAVGAMNGSLNFLSTHPATSDRIAHLEQKLKHSVQGKRYTPLAW